MKISLVLTALAAGLSLTTTAFAVVGESTYNQVCASCHGTGVLNAPKLGNYKQWASLIAEGQVTLTAHAYVGVRSMPAKGGNPNLTIEGFSDALVYMANKAGAKWKSPDEKTITAINKEVEARKAGLSKK